MTNCDHECRNGALESDSNTVRRVERDKGCITCLEFPEVASKPLISFRDELYMKRIDVTHYGASELAQSTISRWVLAVLHIQTVVKDWPDEKIEELKKRVRFYAKGNDIDLIEERLAEALARDNWKDPMIKSARDVTPMIVIIEATYEFITDSKMPPVNLTCLTK